MKARAASTKTLLIGSDLLTKRTWPQQSCTTLKPGLLRQPDKLLLACCRIGHGANQLVSEE